MMRPWLLGGIFVAWSWAAAAHAETDAEDRFRAMDRRIDRLEWRVSDAESLLRASGDTGAVLFLFGSFCALWAQNTGRSAWGWFFLGLIGSVVTVLFLLAKNADDRRSQGLP